MRDGKKYEVSEPTKHQAERLTRKFASITEGNATEDDAYELAACILSNNAQDERFTARSLVKKHKLSIADVTELLTAYNRYLVTVTKN